MLSGGKSVHCYWVLQQPIPAQEWEPLQAELIAYAGGDPHCKDASRVMRLPGCWYVDASGEPTALVEPPAAQLSEFSSETRVDSFP